MATQWTLHRALKMHEIREGAVRWRPVRSAGGSGTGFQGCIPCSQGWATRLRRVTLTVSSIDVAVSLSAAQRLGSNRWKWLLAAFWTLPLACAAQTGPPPGAVPTPEQLRPRLPATNTDASALPPAAPVPRELGKPDDDITLDVTAYDLAADAPAPLRAALPGLTAAFTGKGRGYEDLVNAAAAVTRYLQRELGDYLGYAYLPEQAPAGGVVRIAVLEGRLDQITLNWPDKMPVKREVIEAYLARLKPGEILKVRDVERVVFLVNDLRGVNARFEIKAGRTPGTASLVVTAQPEDRISSRVDIDTLGSRYSGVTRVSLLSTWSSPTGHGDGLVGNLLTSTNSGLRFGLLGYTLPVGADGLKLGASVSAVRYQLDKNELPLDLYGDATTVTVYALYPVVRSRNLNTFALVSADTKQFNDRQGTTGLNVKKKVNDLQLSVSGDARDDLLTGGVNTYEATVVTGKVDLEVRSVNNDNPPNYSLARFNLNRLQNLISNRLLLYASLRTQFAFKNLDNTEQFQLGGPDRVRAFAPGEGTGDAGTVASIELRFLPPEEWFGSYGRIAREVVLSTFFDVGAITFRHDATRQRISSPTFENSKTLSGWGLGAVWDRPRDFALRLYLAFPVSGTAVNDPVVKRPRIYATANKSF